MARSIIMALMLSLTPSSGMWITAEGEAVEKPCPSAMQMTDKARLPQGCVAHMQGVWLSRSTFKDAELVRARLKKELDSAKDREIILWKRIESLELQLKITGVESVCPACDCRSHVVVSTAISLGGCALWTAYQFR